MDKVNGGFYGALTNDLEIHNEVPRSAILCARILWTYATAYRKLGDQEYLAMARWAYDYLTARLFGPGIWRPLLDRRCHRKAGV